MLGSCEDLRKSGVRDAETRADRPGAPGPNAAPNRAPLGLPVSAAMRVAVFSTKAYDRRFLEAANRGFGHRLDYFEARLDASTAALAEGYPAVCVFVNDRVDA